MAESEIEFERKYNCKECGKTADCPMLHDDVWSAAASPKEILCMFCTEIALGRQLTLLDLKNIPFNNPTRVFVMRERAKLNS